MSPAVRTLVETGLVVAFVVLVCVGGWAIEKYEASRAGLSRRAACGARRAELHHSARGERAPHSRSEIRAVFYDLRGIRTRSTSSRSAQARARRRRAAPPR